MGSLEEGEDALVIPQTVNSLYSIPANFTIHPNSSLVFISFFSNLSSFLNLILTLLLSVWVNF